MIRSSRDAILKLFFSPEPWLLLWLFLSLGQIETNLLPALGLVKCSLLLLLMASFTLGLQLLREADGETLLRRHAPLILIAFGLMLVPIISSWGQGAAQQLLEQPFYKTQLKVLWAMILLQVALSSTAQSRRLLDVALCALSVLACAFFYRYRWLGEMREDGRPLLQLNIGDPNFLAALFGAFAPLAFWRARALGSLRRGFVAYGCTLLCVLVVLDTQSRMGILALGASLLFIALRGSQMPWQKKAGLLGGLAACTLLLLQTTELGSIIGARFAQLNDDSNAARLRTLAVGWKLFAMAPWTGMGIDAAFREFNLLAGFARLRSETIALTVHNSPLKLLAEYGLLGFTAMASLYAFAFGKIVQAQRREPFLGLCLKGSLLVLLLNGLTLPLDFQDWLLQTLIVVIALAAAMGESACPSPRSPSASP